MKREEGFFKDSGGEEIFFYKWAPEGDRAGIVQIAHGMAETASRYEWFAQELTKQGYVVYANDHRGHGKTAKTVENVGYIGQDGFNWMIRDLRELNEMIKDENPDMPVFLFGHSMGSMLAQGYISKFGETIKGVILSGTSGSQGIMNDIGILIARSEVKKIGERTPSSRLNKLTFGNYNNEFKPNRTEFDWLSRDSKEVDKYVNDPFCGGIFSAGFFYEFLKGLKEIYKRENMKSIPKKLPIYIFSGEKDPVGKNCKTVIKLIRAYKKLGIEDVSYKFYKDGRHEMLNEINRDEVVNDVIGWLGKH